MWPSPRYHHSATLLGSSLYIIGGAVGVSFIILIFSFELNFDERKKSKYFNDVFVLNIGIIIIQSDYFIFINKNKGERKWELHSSGTEFPDPRAGHITAEYPFYYY